MQPRANNAITMIVAQAIEKMRELKELQFFGGDSLTLKRYTYNISVPPDATDHCWRIVMVPTDPETTMPFEAVTKPATSTGNGNASVEAVARSDSSFEYLVMPNANYGETANLITFNIEYTGNATFTATQIG